MPRLWSIGRTRIRIVVLKAGTKHDVIIETRIMQNTAGAELD